MTTQPPLTHQEVLQSMKVPQHPGVFFIGRAARWVTFQSQQRRALNLAWALCEDGRLGLDVNVAVIGAGLAGLTFAFAAVEKRAKVTLVEAKRIPLYLQRGCQFRFIHPNIYEWPNRASENPLTDLPCLNWGADYAARVCDTILDQWRTRESRVSALYGYEVRGLRPDGKQTLLLAEGVRNHLRNHRELYDLVILAVGFGLEESIDGVQFLSYWENDNFGRALITPPIPRRYLLSGCGDGGLIDAQRLSLNTFDHARFVRWLQYEAGLDEIKQELLQIDRSVTEASGPDFRASAVRQGELLEQEYDRLSANIPPSLVNKIKNDLREDTVVYLNDRRPSPFTLQSSILNRFSVYLLLKYGGLRFRAGQPHIEGERGGPYRVSFKTGDGLEVDEVVVRYGPKSAIGRFLPPEVVKEMDNNPPPTADRTREPHYGNFLLSDELNELKRKVETEHALSVSAMAFQNLYQPLKHDLFRIEVNTGPRAVDETPYFLIRPRYKDDPTAKLELEKYEGIEIRYEAAIGEPLPPVSHTRIRPLVCGAGIENIRDTLLPVPSDQTGPAPSWGTVGCFVRLRETGELALLTSSFAVLAPSAAKGDNIINPPASNDRRDVIGTLHSWIPLTPAGGSDENRAEGAVVLLAKSLKRAARFDTQFKNLPRLSGLREPRLGERVFKVGATSGVTWGRVSEILLSIRVTGEGESFVFRDVIGIEGDNKKPFMFPGDAGAIVVRVHKRITSRTRSDLL